MTPGNRQLPIASEVAVVIPHLDRLRDTAECYRSLMAQTSAPAAIILVVPVVMPLVKAVGIDPVHFGLIVTVNLGIGQQTPPVASVLMVASSIAKESVWSVTRVNAGFIAVLIAVLLLVTYVPVTGMGLVELFYR